MIEVAGEISSDVGSDKSENANREAEGALATETRKAGKMMKLTSEQQCPQRTTRTKLQTRRWPG